MSHSELWPHQRAIFDALMEGKNVILPTTTGTGKTRASLYPWLVSLDTINNQYYGKLPGKCIYTVPMRILAKQFFHEYDEIAKKYGLRYGLEISRKIQTGDQPNDPRFEADLIFATIDQVLSSFLIAPYSLPKRAANLNAGAILSSYLVFDEFHLFDPDSTLPTTLHMLKMLKGIVPFVLMTATFSRNMLDDLAAELDAVIVPHPDDNDAQAAIRALPSQQKTRRYHVVDAPMQAQIILDQHRGRTLVICNTVDRARTIFEQLQAKTTDIDVYLLHSRFLPEDRSDTEDTIRTLFSKEKTDAETNAIVVSTQAIEVGVDISSSILHTELAPANAIIQRAGRCARYEGETGDVFIYGQAINNDGEVINLTDEPAPYMSQKNEFAATLNAFRDRNGDALDFEAERAILSAVHGESDRRIINQLREASWQHRRSMFAVMRGDDDADARHLIRNVVSQRVTIHREPNAALSAAPYDAPAFGLHPGTVKGYLADWLEQGDALDLQDGGLWILHDYGADKTAKERHELESNNERYKFNPVTTKESAWGTPLLVVHPALATYDPTLGFIGTRGNDSSDVWQATLPERGERKAHPPRKYQKETYERHIELVHDAFREYWPEAEQAATKLEVIYGWEAGSIQRAAELAILLHDVGKLSKDWQTWAHRYQQAVSVEDDDNSDFAPITGEAYAHTTVEGDRFREIERSIKPSRPWHAVEGAAASLPVVSAEFGKGHPLTQAVFNAIARHHAPFSDTGQGYKLVDDAAQHIFNLMDCKPQPLKAAMSAEKMTKTKRFIINPELPEHRKAYMAYLLIVRALRRADGTGTERGSIHAR